MREGRGQQRVNKQVEETTRVGKGVGAAEEAAGEMFVKAEKLFSSLGLVMAQLVEQEPVQTVLETAEEATGQKVDFYLSNICTYLSFENFLNFIQLLKLFLPKRKNDILVNVALYQMFLTNRVTDPSPNTSKYRDKNICKTNTA